MRSKCLPSVLAATLLLTGNSCGDPRLEPDVATLALLRDPSSQLSVVAGADAPLPEEVDPELLRLTACLRDHDFERVLCEEDVELSTIEFLHFADEEDTFGYDDYEIRGKGVVLGVQDSHYVVLTTRCAADFRWPNHDVRWRASKDLEDGEPEFLNEGLSIVPPFLQGAKPEIFAFARSNANTELESGDEDEQSRWIRARRDGLRAAHARNRFVTIDDFADGRGRWSDVALIHIPARNSDSFRLRHLGLENPKLAVRELIEKQGSIFGIEFEFSCEECQRCVAGYESREADALILGIGIGLTTAVALPALLLRLQALDLVMARGADIRTLQVDPRQRLARAGLRREILERDGFVCVYSKFGMCDPKTCWACLDKHMQIDHVRAFSKGGDTVPENLVAACAACNQQKGALALSQWMRNHRK